MSGSNLLSFKTKTIYNDHRAHEKAVAGLKGERDGARREGWTQRQGEGKRSCGPEDGGSRDKRELHKGRLR